MIPTANGAPSAIAKRTVVRLLAWDISAIGTAGTRQRCSQLSCLAMGLSPSALHLRAAGSYLLTSCLVLLVSSTGNNVTIDDLTGDEATGLKPIYVPSDSWNEGAGCVFCAAKPDPSQAQGNTWHDASYDPGRDAPPFDFTLQFNGAVLLLILYRVHELRQLTLNRDSDLDIQHRTVWRL